jgi:hypothetical protein
MATVPQGGVNGARIFIGGSHSQDEGIHMEMAPGTSIVNTEVLHFGVCNNIKDCINVVAGQGTALQVRPPGVCEWGGWVGGCSTAGN